MPGDPIQISTLFAEIATLNAWINDLQSGMYVNCVYCGYRYGPASTTPVSMAAALKEHIEQCPKHPMSRLKEAIREAIPLIKDGYFVTDESPKLAIRILRFAIGEKDEL